MQADELAHREVSPSSSGIRKAPAMRRSCELCRASKTKCLPSLDANEKHCQRCIRDGKECVFAPAQQRAKRAQKSQLRVAEMEKKLDGIFALLSTQSQRALTATASPPGQGPSPPETTSTDSPHPTIASAASAASTGPSSITSGLSQAERDNICADFAKVSAMVDDETADMPCAVARRAAPEHYSDLIERGAVPLAAANCYVQRFKAHSSHFPFVVLDASVSASDLRKDRPCLLIAIIAMASAPLSPDQTVAEREMRLYLARKTIVEGEKTLDILQGLLVYLAWYNRYFSPERQNFYQLCQMAISLAVDLGITKPRKPPNGTDPFENTGCGTEPLPVWKAAAVEARRTLLGCYCISSSISQAIRKPTTFKLHSYMDECCATLAEVREAPLDIYLTYYVEMAKLADDVAMTFGFDGGLDTMSLSAVTIELSAKSFKARLEAIRQSFPDELLQNAALMMQYHHLNVYICEICLYIPHDAGISAATTLSSVKHQYSWIMSTTRTETFISFLTACNNYLDAFLRMSWADVQRNTLMDTSRLIYVIMLLGFATLDIQCPPIPREQIQDVAQLPKYLEKLSAMMATHVTTVNGEVQKDMYWQYKFVFDNSRARYLRRLNPVTAAQANGRYDPNGCLVPLPPPRVHSPTSAGGQTDVVMSDQAVGAGPGHGVDQSPDVLQWTGEHFPYNMYINDDSFWTEMYNTFPSIDGSA